MIDDLFRDLPNPGELWTLWNVSQSSVICVVIGREMTPGKAHYWRVLGSDGKEHRFLSRVHFEEKIWPDTQ